MDGRIASELDREREQLLERVHVLERGHERLIEELLWTREDLTLPQDPHTLVTMRFLTPHHLLIHFGSSSVLPQRKHEHARHYLSSPLRPHPRRTFRPATLRLGRALGRQVAPLALYILA